MNVSNQLESPTIHERPDPREAWQPGIRPRAVLRAFAASPECARLEPRERELEWAQELLEAMEVAGWSWLDLDLEMFEAVLLDGLGWSIEQAPADPGRVARVLDAFLCFADREYGAPHAGACCTYLRTAGAVEDIARWLRPFDESSEHGLFAELSPPFDWCDGRCDRCPLSASCPVHEVEDATLSALIDGGGDPDERRAARLATAPAIAAGAVPAAGAAVEDSSEIDLPSAPPEAARLRELCREYAFAVLTVSDALPARLEETEEVDLRADAILVAVKGSRVACHLSPAGALEDEDALMDGVPNLLLLERVMNGIEARVAAHGRLPPCAAGYRRARDQLGRALQPLLRSIPPRIREEVQFRILTGTAPSPFSCSS
ncbi:MAG TPA: hypothetical protein VKB80_04335 [Kofleriaceae bacterium]|nr:hypothetical protein [Kofleriaceae bacterium]